MTFARIACAAALALAVPLAPAANAATTGFIFHCRVTNVAQLDHLGREGQAAELSQFTCHVHGGVLDGFSVSGTNIWELATDGAVLLGSIAVAHRADATLVYEVEQATRRSATGAGRSAKWQGTGRGTYKLATGSVAALAGKTFHTMARYEAPDAFTIETVVEE